MSKAILISLSIIVGLSFLMAGVNLAMVYPNPYYEAELWKALVMIFMGIVSLVCVRIIK